MRKAVSGISAALIAAAFAVFGVPGVAHAAYSDCPERAVCFYTGYDGTGNRCTWKVDDNSWTTGNSVCSWATTTNVKSIYNHGTNTGYTGVAYYSGKDYDPNTRKGCTRQGVSGNLQGTYKLLSHKWITSTCG